MTENSSATRHDHIWPSSHTLLSFFPRDNEEIIMPTKVTHITWGHASNELLTKIDHIDEFMQKISLAQDNMLKVYEESIARKEHQRKLCHSSLKSISSSISYILQ